MNICHCIGHMFNGGRCCRETHGYGCKCEKCSPGFWNDKLSPYIQKQTPFTDEEIKKLRDLLNVQKQEPSK